MTIESKSYRMYIGGNWIDSNSGARYTRESPAHDVQVGDYPQGNAEDADAAVASARVAFDEGPWPGMSGAERSKLLLKVSRILRDRREDLAVREVLESGKPISQSRAEMDTAAELWEYAAALSRSVHGDAHNTLGSDMLAFVFREPIGVVAMVTPWNFPLLIISQKLPFALAAGCTAVVKPSELTPGTTLELAKILDEAGIPAGVVNVVVGFGDPVGTRLAEHPDVDMMSFTGSTRVGKSIMAAAAGNVKKVELELGGKNPQVVFPDCDVEAAIDAVVFGVYFNMGECCNSGSRVLVHRSFAAQFMARVRDLAKSVTVGDPLEETTKIGAIINRNQYDKIVSYVADAQKAGATLAVGGRPMRTSAGRFFEPTVFENVRPEMAIAKEEVFGPVLSAIEFDTIEEAIRIANSTTYGLSAGVWTRDTDTAFRLARGIRAGTIWINSFMDGYPELSFGGYRQSGLGRELGRFSIDEFTELKTVQLHLGARTNWWVSTGSSESTRM